MKRALAYSLTTIGLLSSCGKFENADPRNGKANDDSLLNAGTMHAPGTLPDEHEVGAAGGSTGMTGVPEPPTKVPSRPPPDARDSGTPTVPPPSRDAGVPKSNTCGVIAAGAFDVAGAGSGTTSGCAPRACEGVSIAGYTDTELDQLVTRPADYAGCTSIHGDLIVSKSADSDLSALSCLETTSGSMLIWSNQHLTSLHGLESLLQVNGDLQIGVDFNAYDDNVGLQRFDALSHLKAVKGSLNLGFGAGLVSTAGLDALQVVGGDVSLASLEGTVTDFAGLNRLVTVGGLFNLWRFSGLRTVSGLKSLREVESYFALGGESQMETFAGFPSLECTGGFNVDLGSDSGVSSDSLTRVAVLPSLRRILGDVNINYGSALSEVDLLQNVELITGNLGVTGNAALTTMPLHVGLDYEGRSISVTQNPMLSTCAFAALAATVPASRGLALDLTGSGGCATP